MTAMRCALRKSRPIWMPTIMTKTVVIGVTDVRGCKDYVGVWFRGPV